MIAFILTMPNAGSWNGKWSCDGELFARVKSERNIPKDIIGKRFCYRWDDGWTACVEVVKVSSAEANKMRRKSKGFCGYDWMLESIIENKEIKVDE